MYVCMLKYRDAAGGEGVDAGETERIIEGVVMRVVEEEGGRQLRGRDEFFVKNVFPLQFLFLIHRVLFTSNLKNHCVKKCFYPRSVLRIKPPRKAVVPKFGTSESQTCCLYLIFSVV